MNATYYHRRVQVIGLTAFIIAAMVGIRGAGGINWRLIPPQAGPAASRPVYCNFDH